MAYDLGGSDLRVVSGINLILSVMKELRRLKTEIETVGDEWRKFGLIPFVDQLKMVTGTSGNQIANDYLVEKLQDLNHELGWKFPHKEMIRRANQRALDACLIAISKHSQRWEKMKISVIIKALGTQQVLDEPEILPHKTLSYDKEGEEWD